MSKSPAWFQKHVVSIRPTVWSVPSMPQTSAETAPAVVEPESPVAAVVPIAALEAAEQAIAAHASSLADSESRAAALREELAAAQDATAQAQQALADVTARLLTGAETELVKLALAIAERVVSRELATAPELIIAWAREAIAASALGEGLTVAISTDLSGTVDGMEWGELEPVVDPALAPSTCEISDGKSVVTVGGGERLDLVAEELAAIPARAA